MRIHIRSTSSKNDVSIRIEIRDSENDENASLEVTRIPRTDLNANREYTIFEPAIEIASNILERRGLKIKGDVYKHIQNAVNIIAYSISVVGKDCDVSVDIPVKLIKIK